jgi:hypothetical protein
VTALDIAVDRGLYQATTKLLEAGAMVFDKPRILAYAAKWGIKSYLFQIVRKYGGLTGNERSGES